MKRHLFVGSRRFEIETEIRLDGPSPDGAALRLDHASALWLLRRIAAAPGNLAQLRSLLAEAALDSAVDRLADAEVLAELAILLLSGRAVLRDRGTAHLRGLDGDPDEPLAPSSARAPAAPRTWIEIQLIGEDGEPLPGERYRVTLPDGSVREGSLDGKGLARLDGIDPGTCTVTFPALDEEAWARA